MDNIVCIYKITNTVTGDFYIGQTHDFEQRIKGHKKKPAPKMREDVEKYGWDAFKFEILEECTDENLTERENHYIKMLNPIYNTMPWGNDMPEEVCKKISQGLMGHPTSPETRRKISEANTGRTHTEESCEKMSEKRLGVTLSDDHKEKCRQSSLGNKSRSKAVVCVETGKVYPNMKSAAADVGISPSMISCVIRGVNITAGGYHWRYADEDANKGSRKRNVAVFCEDTGEFFPTLEAAAKKFGINASTIGKIVRGKCKSSLHFKRVEEPVYNEIRGEDKRNNNLPDAVICVETGERFESIRKAAKAVGIPNTSISCVLKGKMITAGGYHWQYADDRPNNIRDESTRQSAKSVVCLETGEIFPSLKIAAETLNINHSSLCGALKGRCSSVHGLHFKYFEEVNSPEKNTELKECIDK